MGLLFICVRRQLGVRLCGREPLSGIFPLNGLQARAFPRFKRDFPAYCVAFGASLYRAHSVKRVFTA